MSETHVPAAVRRHVAARAQWRCEYFGIAETDTWFGCEVDHVVSEKHEGSTIAENLAMTCVPGNRYKGSDVATINAEGNAVRLFHPRQHLWAEHFKREGVRIVGRTVIGQATVNILKMNSPERLAERFWSGMAGS